MGKRVDFTVLKMAGVSLLLVCQLNCMENTRQLGKCPPSGEGS
jgi:hypothetical protein